MRFTVLLLTAAFFFSTYAEGSAVLQKSSFYGGLSIPLGEGSELINVAPTAGGETYALIGNIYGVGGHAEYSLFSVKSQYLIDGAIGLLHFWDLSMVNKINLKLTENSSFLLEIDPGFYLGLASVSYGGRSESDFEPSFGMTFGTGWKINYLTLGFKFKMAMSEMESTKWVSFVVGFST